jgi:hypothetical protein
LDTDWDITMNRPLQPMRTLLILSAALLAEACTSSPIQRLGPFGSRPQTPSSSFQRPDLAAMRAKQQLMQDLMNNPDLPAWHEEREKLMLGQGDRTFDRPFDQVFDGMIMALATMGSRVSNMERGTGYITGSLPDLGPERNQALQAEALSEYVQAKGYPPSVLQQQGSFDFINVNMGQNMMNRMGGSGLTLTMVRQSPTQTKVKVRFDNVYYPKTELELYQHVWGAVDRQMFLDRSLDH